MLENSRACAQVDYVGARPPRAQAAGRRSGVRVCAEPQPVRRDAGALLAQHVSLCCFLIAWQHQGSEGFLRQPVRRDAGALWRSTCCLFCCDGTAASGLLKGFQRNRAHAQCSQWHLLDAIEHIPGILSVMRHVESSASGHAVLRSGEGCSRADASTAFNNNISFAHL